MASVQNIGLNNDEKKGENEKNDNAMPNESPNTQNKNPIRDTYWFAHGGIENISSKSAQSTSKSPNASDLKDAQLQKDKEERFRMFREQQEEERLKKLKDLEQQFLQAKKLREQQEEERKRRIEEARIKETERRQQVEERKRQIWEAEQERKEAILRRNMEREARIEARRNAQRMAQSFAFGSSTPRTFDLDLAAIGVGRNTSSGLVLMSSVSGRRSEERELGPPRATSACSLDRKFGEDCMSRSMVSLSSSAFRGRKRTDIMPTLTRERSITPHVTPRGNHCMRAVSMTRLDQLAQPRRPYRDSRNLYSSPTTTNGGPRAISPSMTKSMCNLANTSSVMRKSHVSMSNNRRGNMSQSMMHLADTPQKDTTQMTPSPRVPKSGMRSAQSMMHLAAPQPRLTRAARLRAQALASSRASSAWNLSKPDTMVSGQYLSPGKDTSRSPSRPQSSMSGASEISATSSSISAVNMRTRSAPRRPRPFSIAGSVVDRASSTTTIVKKEPENQRQPRLQDRNAQTTVNKPLRAKSVGREKTDDAMPKPLSAPKKPVPPPKSKEVLARAKSHPVPTKDNLRKNVRPNITNTAKANIEKQLEDKGKLLSNEPVNSLNKVESAESKSENAFDIVNSSPITSPVTDSEMCISSEDSRIITESDVNSHTQTFSESEDKADQSKSISISKEKIVECQEDANSETNIPNQFEQKVTSLNTSDQLTAQSQLNEAEQTVTIPQRPRITSEEEARAALAEKRRLAREQAEREAELERQRQEELRRQEEERQRIEEEKQREMELEQIRLAEVHRQMEEEKLKKAIEEQKQREKEEQERRQEEARLKAEKEEQERKAREEAEKQRLELEERLRKEEEERAERKRRVEQIMARTRGKSAQTPPATTPVDTTNKIVKIEDSNQSNNSSENVKTNVISPAQESTKANYIINGSAINKLENNFHSSSIANNYVSSANSYQFVDEKMSSSAPLPDLLTTNNIANSSIKSNGHHVNDEQFSSTISVTNSFNHTSTRTLSAMEITSPTQTNGYSSHEDMSCTTSPEELSDTGLLVNIGNSQQNDNKSTTIQSVDFTKLVDIESSSLSMDNENFLINVDSVNSNILSSEKSYPGFEECLQKKSDSTVADLLS